MLRFSTAAVLLLLAWFCGLLSAEVVIDFSLCKEFLYEGKEPVGITGDNYKRICQRYENNYRFATLYDQDRRAPLYSAYKLRPKSEKCKRPDDIDWKYEPQLADSTGREDMQPFPKDVSEEVINSQAVLNDYKESGYTKGHLNPSMHQETQEDCNATFTLTNVVPQSSGSNNGPWGKVEKMIQKRLQTHCTGEMYVITGGMPYEEEKWMKNRVSIPEYMWSAYCCSAFAPNLTKDMKYCFPTYAVVGRNDKNSPNDIVKKVKGYDVKQMSLVDLQGILMNRLNLRTLSLFDNDCLNIK